MPDIRRLVRQLEALLREFPDPITVPAELSKGSRTNALRRLRAAIQRLETIAQTLAGSPNVSDLVSATEELAAALPVLDGLIASHTAGKRRNLRNRLDESVQALSAFAARLDPVLVPDAEFDPADPHIIGQLIAKAMIGRDRVSLGSLDDHPFYGSGVYAIYYHGPFDAYQPIAGTDHPIYVGKVDPQDVHATVARDQGQKLWNRLARDHLRSLKKIKNLRISDFDCRYLVVRSAWQKTAEDYLISLFKPIWNNETRICFGFGKHGDKASTRTNTVSPWDTLHPGRSWAADEGNRSNPKSPEVIKREIAAHFTENPQIVSIDSGISLTSTESP